MKRIAFMIVLSAGFVAIAFSQIAPSGAPGETTTIATTPSASPAPQAGYVAHFDENGKFVEEPIASTEGLHAALAASINTSSEGLVEVASPVSGMMIDLQGRFQAASTATVDANGNVYVPCLTNEADVRALAPTAAPSAAKE